MCCTYRITSNKRWGRSFNFWHFFFFFWGGGVYSREAFIRGRRLLQNTEKITILYINVNDIVVFYPKNDIICFINVWICDQIELWYQLLSTILTRFTFLETVNQTIFRTISVKIQTTRFERVGKKGGGGAFIRRGRL